MRAASLILAGVVLVVAALAFALRPTTDVEPLPASTTPPAEKTETPPAAPMSASVAPTAPQKKNKPNMLVFPDGSEYPLLNGAQNAGPVQWPPNKPFSPVIGKHVDNTGLEWYDHADGTQTTTQVTWRKDLNRYDGVTVVAVPDGKPRMIAPEEGSPRGAAPGGTTPSGR